MERTKQQWNNPQQQLQPRSQFNWRTSPDAPNKKKGSWAWVHQKNKKSEELLVEELGKPLQIFKVDASIVVNFHETKVEILSNHRSFGTQRIVITYPTFVSLLGILPLL